MVKYLLDSSSLKEYYDISNYITLNGLTTNPSILHKEIKEKDLLIQFFKEVKSVKGEVHVQTTKKTAKDIVEEARALKKHFNEETEFFIKIPVNEEGLKATKILSQEGINVTMTAVFSVGQVIAAEKAGAYYVAPYINRMANIGIDPIEVIKQMKLVLANTKTQILAASFKNVKQLNDIIALGVGAITASPDIIKASIWNPYTDKSIKDFDKDWEQSFGETDILNFI